MKWRRDDRQKILDTYWDATKLNWSSDLVVWPEVAIPGRSEDLQEEILLPMSMQASENNSNLLTGIVVSDWMKREYYNSMMLMGDHQGVYHKRHLVPFGEYYPFRQLLSFMKSYINIPMSDMKAGPDEQPMMSVNAVKLGVSICYEDVFSRDINRDLPAANILVNTSNDAWFGDSLAPHQHLEIAQMRSLETERPMVRSTNTGQSAFIDYKGAIIDITDQFKAQTLTAEIQGRSGSTPFIYFAKIQSWLAFLILGLSILMIKVVSRKS
jgi:apolipoprotein N-acyltransferase